MHAYQNVYLLAHTTTRTTTRCRSRGRSNRARSRSLPTTPSARYGNSRTMYPIMEPAAVLTWIPSTSRTTTGHLAYDHTHILNLAYIWNLPNFVHSGSNILREAANGWQFSGYTSFQSGAPLQPGLNGNMNATFPGGLTVPTEDHPDLPDNSILLPNGLRSVCHHSCDLVWYRLTTRSACPR